MPTVAYLFRMQFTPGLNQFCSFSPMERMANVVDNLANALQHPVPVKFENRLQTLFSQ
jgi:hypothetical protein